MNLAQSPTCPAPSSWFVPYPFVPPPPPPLPNPISYRMKVLQFLNSVSGDIAFGEVVKGVLFHEIYDTIGGESALSTTLHHLRKAGFIESSGRPGQTRYRITMAGGAVASSVSIR